MKLYDYIKKNHVFRRRLVSAGIVASLLIALPVTEGLSGGRFQWGITAYATSAEEKKEQAEDELNQVQDDIDTLTGQQSEIQGELSETAQQLSDILSAQDLLEIDMENKQIEIDQANADLIVAQQKEAEQYEAMKLRIQFMYENGTNDSIWTAILQSEGISDMLNRIEYVTQVYNSDRDMMDTYQETVAQVEALTVQLATEMDDLVAMQESYDEQEDQLAALMADLEAQSDDYAQQIADARELADQKTKEIEEANAEIKRQEEARRLQEEEEERRRQQAASANSGSNSGSGSSSGSGSTGQDNNGGSGSSGTIGNSSYLTDDSNDPEFTSGVSPEDLVAFARSHVGNPYVWGGNSLTNGCDCSGFVKLVYAHFGLDPGVRYSQSFANVGKPVSYNNMKAGDIVVYPGHVAIYMGNGKIVEAQSSKAGITDYRSVNCHTITAIRRLL